MKRWRIEILALVNIRILRNRRLNFEIILKEFTIIIIIPSEKKYMLNPYLWTFRSRYKTLSFTVNFFSFSELTQWYVWQCKCSATENEISVQHIIWYNMCAICIVSIFLGFIGWPFEMGTFNFLVVVLDHHFELDTIIFKSFSDQNSRNHFERKNKSKKSIGAVPIERNIRTSFKKSIWR